jgi:cell division protein FtsQ
MKRRNRLRGKRVPRSLGRQNAKGAGGWLGNLGKSILSLAVLASLTLLGYTLFQYFKQSSSIPLGEIKIVGTMNASETELLNLAGVDFTTSLMNLDLKEVSRRLRQHPWVEKAKVKRDWARKALIIEVQERVPKAVILLDDLYLIDRNGEVFKKAENKDRMDYPILTGMQRQEVESRDSQTLGLIRQALEFLTLLEKRRVFTVRDVSEINLHKKKGLTVYTVKEGIPIRLGSGNLVDKLDRLEKVLPDLYPRGKEIEYLDLNYARKVVVKMKEHEKEKSRKS